MAETAMIWFCILVAVLGVLALATIIFFGLVLTRDRLWRHSGGSDVAEWLLRHMTPGPGREQIARYIADAYAEYLQRRNEFWTTYGQVVLAVLIIVVLSILLLTKTISAEAGLPILSGVSGFAIAKGVAAGRTMTPGPGRPNE